MTLGEALMRLVSTGEGIAFRDLNLELRGLPRRVQALEFANAGDAVIADQGHPAPFLRRRLDAVGVRNTAAGSNYVHTSLQRVSAGESQHGIDAIRCKLARLIVDIDALAIDSCMRTHFPHQLYPFLARCSCKY